MKINRLIKRTEDESPRERSVFSSDLSVTLMRNKAADLWCFPLTIPRLEHEVSVHLLPVDPVNVSGHQHVAAVVDVRGVVQLQAAVVLPLCDVVDLGGDVSVLRHLFAVHKPLQLRPRVSWSGYRDIKHSQLERQ